MAFEGPPPSLSEEDSVALEGSARKGLLEALRHFDAEGEALVTIGPAGPALLTVARERSANLIVVGTTGLTGLSRMLLGSVAEMVASEASCSVMITRLHQSKS